MAGWWKKGIGTEFIHRGDWINFHSNLEKYFPWEQFARRLRVRRSKKASFNLLQSLFGASLGHENFIHLSTSSVTSCSRYFIIFVSKSSRKKQIHVICLIYSCINTEATTSSMTEEEKLVTTATERKQFSAVLFLRFALVRMYLFTAVLPWISQEKLPAGGTRHSRWWQSFRR